MITSLRIVVLPDPRAELAWQGFKLQWWRAAGLQSLGEHRPSLQTLHCTPHQHGHGSMHWHTSPGPVPQSTPPHQVFSAPTRWPSEALNQTPSPGLQNPCRVSCWQLDTSLAAAWQQRLHLLCLCMGQSLTGNHWLTPTIWWGCPQSSAGLSWPALSVWDHGSFSCPLYPSYPCRSRQWNCSQLEGTLPSQMIAAARSQIMEVPMSQAALIISSTMPDRSSALPALIWENAFLTISVMIGMGGPSTGGSSDR